MLPEAGIEYDNGGRWDGKVGKDPQFEVLVVFLVGGGGVRHRVWSVSRPCFLQWLLVSGLELEIFGLGEPGCKVQFHD